MPTLGSVRAGRCRRRSEEAASRPACARSGALAVAREEPSQGGLAAASMAPGALPDTRAAGHVGEMHAGVGRGWRPHGGGPPASSDAFALMASAACYQRPPGGKIEGARRTVGLLAARLLVVGCRPDRHARAGRELPRRTYVRHRPAGQCVHAGLGTTRGDERVTQGQPIKRRRESRAYTTSCSRSVPTARGVSHVSRDTRSRRRSIRAALVLTCAAGRRCGSPTTRGGGRRMGAVGGPRCGRRRELAVRCGRAAWLAAARSAMRDGAVGRGLGREVRAERIGVAARRSRALDARRSPTTPRRGAFLARSASSSASASALLRRRRS